MKNKERIQAAYNKLAVHRWIAWLLCAALVGGMVSTALPALAVNDDGEETYEDEADKVETYEDETLCEHHPVHTEACGYVEAVEGQPCKHEHDDECGYVEAAEAVESQPCTHEHDEKCGYVEAVEGQPCGYVCEICGGGSEETEMVAALSEDQPIAPRAIQEEGLIAYFTFDEGTRLNNSANSGVTAKLCNANEKSNEIGDEISNGNLEDYFGDTDGYANALHLDGNTCLVLENTEAFKGLTELTVEMKVKITEEKPQHWLFYAKRGDNVNDCLGAGILDNNTDFRAIRGNTLKWVDWKYSGGVLTVDEWHTIRVVYKISTMAIYIDNERVAESGAGGRTAYYFENSPDIWFGHSAFTNDTNFNGYIDDIKIYNYARDDYPLNEEQYILESVDPPNTTVHMFDYWITEQTNNDFDPSLSVGEIWEGGINNGHLFLFCGDNVTYPRCSIEQVGSWNYYRFGDPNGRKDPFSGIVKNVLNNGYPQLAIDDLQKNNDMYYPPNDQTVPEESRKMLDNVAKQTESLKYLFDPDWKHVGKASYRNVTGLFRLDEKGYYYFDCNKTFAELNREQGTRPKVSITGNNRITLFQRSSTYKDFFPFNDATDLFYISMDNNDVDKANGDDMGIQATTDEPFNHYFGMTVETKFQQPTDGLIDRPGGKEPMVFDFSGDDDVWIFIDDVLVADLGGIHNEAHVNINFSTGEIVFEKSPALDTSLKDMFGAVDNDKTDVIEWNENGKLFADGSEHTLKFFYLERGNAASRCTISFNMQHVEKHTHKKRSSSENVPVEPLYEEFVTLDVSTEEPPKKKEEAKTNGVLASPNTGDSNMVGLWFTLLMLSTAGIAAIHRTRKRGSK